MGLRVVKEMRQRKKLMLEGSGSVVALPGGSGTYEELFEAITLKRLGRWVGPIVLVNTAGFYDGLINLGCFNCQPAMNSQAIIRPLANEGNMPYSAIDCEGPWISANQKELLETVAMQAKRLRKEKQQCFGQTKNPGNR